MRVSLSRKKNNGGFAGLALRLQNDFKNVAVGVLDGAGSYPGGASIADVARWNSEGTSTIPARPFLRKVLREKRQQYRRMLVIISRLTMNGYIGAARARRNLGIRAQNDVKRCIKSYSSPPNAPSTVAQKGFNDPLVHTKTLMDVIDWQEEDVDS